MDLIFVLTGFRKRRVGQTLIENRYWAEYNEGLTKITDPEKCGPVVIASGCGHFIQKDGPNFVAKEVMEMLEKLKW